MTGIFSQPPGFDQRRTTRELRTASCPIAEASRFAAHTADP
jgi:hypothetical protein